jgi:2-oxoglutarate dehydrogenase E1 component
VAKAFNAPVFHVNADDPEAVVRVCKAALEWRQKFKRDVVIDLIGWRQHGHNEIDEPNFTQPHMYSVIAKKASTLDVYTKRLIAEGSVTQAEVTAMSNAIKAHMEEKFSLSKNFKTGSPDWFSSKWSGLLSSKTFSKIRNTGVNKEHLQSLGARLTALPSDFVPHRVVKSVYENRGKTIAGNAGIDWCV